MQPRVILLKSWTTEFGKKHPIGTVLQMIPTAASELIMDGIAKKYEGEYPPKNKIKVDLKTIKQ
jgi:hypothetical protein